MHKVRSKSEADLSSRASQNSPFHMFIQTTDPNQEDLELRWLTLAVGIQFIRETQADEYLTARYYQLEAMLASALGSSTRRATTTNSVACNGGRSIRPIPPRPGREQITTALLEISGPNALPCVPKTRLLSARRLQESSRPRGSESNSAPQSRETCTSVHTPDARGSREGGVSGRSKPFKVTMPGTTVMLPSPRTATFAR